MADRYAEQFFSGLHKTHLKPLGYKKERHTFSRELPEYIERFQFQGSQWNSPGEPWVFYINVGLQFHDLPRRVPDRDFPNTHAHGRIERLTRSDAANFELTKQNTTEMLLQVSALVAEASATIERLAPSLYPKCKEGLCVGFPNKPNPSINTDWRDKAAPAGYVKRYASRGEES